jgi:hypothetical protein
VACSRILNAARPRCSGGKFSSLMSRVKYRASLIRNGSSRTFCAVWKVHEVRSPFPSVLLSSVPRGIGTPGANAPSVSSGSSRTTAMDGIGER